MDELLVSFKNLATYYGEDNPSEFTAKGFFGNIEAFINTYQVTRGVNVYAYV
jgi:hypothetical protein